MSRLRLTPADAIADTNAQGPSVIQNLQNNTLAHKKSLIGSPRGNAAYTSPQRPAVFDAPVETVEDKVCNKRPRPEERQVAAVTDSVSGNIPIRNGLHITHTGQKLRKGSKS